MFITWFDFTQTCLYIKVLHWNYFCGFLEILWDFIWKFNPSFSVPEMSDWLTAGRLGRSTVAVGGRPDRSTDVHKTCTQPSSGGRSTGTVDRQRALLSGKPPVDRAVDQAESTALCFQTRSTERSTDQIAVALWIWHGRLGGRPLGSTVKNLTASRSTDRRPEGHSGPF